MKPVELNEVNAWFWKVYVDRDKRDELAAALYAHRAVISAVLHEDHCELIAVNISARADDDDRADLRILIHRVVGGHCEPEKPTRSSILDEKWHKNRGGDFHGVFDENGIGVLKYDDLLERVPDLLRALEKHHIAYHAPETHAETNAVLAEMGIVFGE